MREAFGRRGVEFQRPYRLSELAQVEVNAGNLDRRPRPRRRRAGGRVRRQQPAGLGVGAATRPGSPAPTSATTVGAADDAAELRSWGVDHDQPPRHADGRPRPRSRRAGRVATRPPRRRSWRAAVSLAATLGYRHPGYMALLPDADRGERRSPATSPRCEQFAAELDVQAAALGAAVGRRRRRTRPGTRSRSPRAAPTPPTALAEAAATFDALGYRLDAARSALLQGRALRRAGRRNDAGAVLADAQARFAAMGAKPWADQAGAELERVAPGRLPGELTATEVAGRRPRRPSAGATGRSPASCSSAWRPSRPTSPASTASSASGRAPSWPGGVRPER